VVAISVLAALFSGVTYLAAPAETFFYDLRYLWVLLSFLIATPITTVIFLPFFRQLNLYTAYEYLERRFDWRLRWIASSLFILHVTFYLGLAIYAPALVVMEVTGWPLWLSALATGFVATIYTTLGGMKAVIWTDTLQFIVLCGGIVVVFAFAGAQVPGGLQAAWSVAAADGKTRFFDFSFDPTLTGVEHQDGL
jgi:solute carrier family 5 (sodium-coupled monocarboxylate transporter), member 8/12